MLSLKILRTFLTSERPFVRNLRNRGRIQGGGPNPGLNKRLGAFKSEGIQIETDNVEEFIEGANSDLINAGKEYFAHQNEAFIGKHVMPKMIVKEKYFKDHLPNLLTWSEKEQIRHLATVHPDEWTPERLAESFPVTVAVVKKLLKFPWKPATDTRIARHDASAMRNWRELKEGTLGVPEDLREHFMKFSERTIPPLQVKSIKIDVTPKQDLGEFQRIVTKCATKDKGTLETEETKALEKEALIVTQNKKKDKKMITLEELTNKIKQRLNTGSDVDLPDQLMINSVKSVEPTNEQLHHQIVLEPNNTVMIKKKEEVVLKAYPERIRVPKKAYKRGATYKVNDCFYDDDGRLLYRVIGMTGK